MRFLLSKLFLWTAITVIALYLLGLVQWMVAPGSSWSLGRYALSGLESLPAAFALFLPVLGFAAGVAAGGRSERAISGKAALAGAVIAAVVALLILGFFAPWVARAVTFDSAGATMHFDSDELDLVALRAYADSLSAGVRASGASGYDALAWMRASSMRYYFHIRIAGAALALLTIPLGFLIGRRAPSRRGSWALVETWAIGVALFITVFVFLVLGKELTEQRNVPAAYTAWLPLLTPAVAVITLAWAARRDPPAAP